MDYKQGLNLIKWAKALLVVRIILIVIFGFFILVLITMPVGSFLDRALFSVICINIVFWVVTLTIPVIFTYVVLYFLNKKVFEPFREGNLTGDTKNATLVLGILCFFIGGWLGIIAAVLLLLTFASWNEIVADLYGVSPQDPYYFARGGGRHYPRTKERSQRRTVERERRRY